MELFYNFNGFQLLFSALFRLLGGVWGAVWGISAVSATFSRIFFRLLGWVWGAVWGISAVSATFSCSFPAFALGLGCCFTNFCGFSYFFLLFSGFCAGFRVLFGEFPRFQLLFSALFPDFWLGLGCCSGDFCGFSYFFPDFFRLFGWVWGAVWGISAVSAPQGPLSILSTYGYCTL